MPTCYDAFNTALAERAKYPLSEGQYKLEEAERTIQRWQQMLETIAERIRAGGTFDETENLGPCMAHERGIHLKRLPLDLAELIGYTILPAIAALDGDGVQAAEVRKLLNRAKTSAMGILAECEGVRLGLKGGIEREYRLMRQGRSDLYGLLSDARALTNFTL